MLRCGAGIVYTMLLPTFGAVTILFPTKCAYKRITVWCFLCVFEAVGVSVSRLLFLVSLFIVFSFVTLRGADPRLHQMRRPTHEP